MSTRHQIIAADARALEHVTDQSVHCVVTSPPYPMIALWDQCFERMNPEVGVALRDEDGMTAYELMHELLHPVWQEVHRCLVPGGIACINIGDATRTLNGEFRLYPNHARIIEQFVGLGMQTLPSIIWRKQTNAPNKFMGSGMLPAGAYPTLEHEHILVFRKGGKREFKDAEAKRRRRESAYFWEERNQWFSDVWMDIKGVGQELNIGGMRTRSGAFPFEIAYRLVNMFSLRGDTVLEPFLGTGTTTLAAIAAERNSIGIELDPDFVKVAGQRIQGAAGALAELIGQRLEAHKHFVEARTAAGKEMKKHNTLHDVPCISAQETDLELRGLRSIKQVAADCFEAEYECLESQQLALLTAATKSPVGNVNSVPVAELPLD